MPEISENNVEMLRAAFLKEPVARFFNMRLVDLEPGHSRIAMKMKPEYQNFNGMVFGGVIMSLIDQAFAYAVNSQAYPSYAADLHVQFLSGPGPDDDLVVEGRVVRNGRRVAFCEITVTNQAGKLVAKADGITVRVNQA